MRLPDSRLGRQQFGTPDDIDIMKMRDHHYVHDDEEVCLCKNRGLFNLTNIQRWSEQLRTKSTDWATSFDTDQPVSMSKQWERGPERMGEQTLVWQPIAKCKIITKSNERRRVREREREGATRLSQLFGIWNLRNATQVCKVYPSFSLSSSPSLSSSLFYAF